MKVPQHLAIIMDGNGRWARSKGKPRTFGHIKGTRVAKKMIRACAKQGVQVLTLYAFSSENWLRPETEVFFLMTLLQRYLKKETQNLVTENIRFSVIGDLSKVSSTVLKALDHAVESTQNCTGMNLVFALSYGSRQEITSGVRSICEKVLRGQIKIEDINEMTIHKSLMTFPFPDPDLIIRTSGELRISNFLLWQAAYSELYFTQTLWPDFTEQDLNLAFEDFGRRDRRFGRVEKTLNFN
ncbi:MAG TPA: isoprenyl transferase [Pseudobdellovibrionaceae bacterium]|nr:isoprenyl transferase [Pseudobdellovibrionaceae bacterium]